MAGRPFPSPLVAAVHAAPSDVAAEAVTGFSIAPGLDDASPVLAVTFADPFALPTGSWRVSLLVGDPDGEQVRTSLRASGGTTTGRIETGSPTGGGSWAVVGETDAAYDPSGLVVLTLDTSLLPVADGATPQLSWVEVVVGDGDPVITPWFSWADVAGTGTPGLVPSGRFVPLAAEAGTEGASGPPAVVDLGIGPEVGLVSATNTAGAPTSTILVLGGAAPPSVVDGVAVTESVDLLRIAPDYVDDAVLTPYVEINNTTGAVRLVDGRTWPPPDATGDSTWLLATNVPDTQGRPVTAIDLTAVLTAVGASPARDAVALGMSRTLLLEDGRQVVAEGVLGDVTWLDTAVGLVSPVQTVPPTAFAPVAEPTTSDDTIDWILAVAAAVLLLAGLSLVVAGRRQRAAAGSVRIPPHEEGPVADVAPTAEVAPTVAEPEPEPAPATMVPMTQSTAVIKTATAADLAAAEQPPMTSTIGRAVVAPMPTPEPPPTPTPEPDRPPEAATEVAIAAAPTPQANAISSLDDDLDALAARLANLDDGAP